LPFKWVNLYRYRAAQVPGLSPNVEKVRLTADEVGRYNSNAVDP
jgi:hypothetical protein